MSKKIVVQNGKPKKKHGCLTCFLVTLIVFVVLVGAGTGVGCYFLDRYTKANFDMSLGQVLGVTNGLYWASDKKMVDYAYSDDDYDKFETEIKHQLFLKDDADLDLVAAVESMTENNPTENALRRAVSEATGEGNTSSSGGDTSSSGGTNEGEKSSNKLFDFIAGLYTDENVDRERLAAYTDDKYGEYTFHLNDRQLAAFAANLLDALAENQSNLKDICTQLHLDKLSDGIALRQIKFTRENRAVRVDGEVGEAKDVTVLRATVQVKVLDISKRMTEGISNGFVRGLARWGIRTLLPNNIYATVGIGLTDNIGLDLTINRLSGEKMENAYKLLDGIMKVTSSNGSEETAGVKANLNKFADETLAPMFEKVNGTVDFAAVENGTVTFDTFGTLADMASKDSEETLTGQELLGTFSKLTTSERPAYDSNYDYEGWYDDNGTPTHIADPSQAGSLQKIDYGQAFTDELRDKYHITQPLTLKELLDALTDETLPPNEVLAQIIAVRAAATTAGTEESLRMHVDDRTLAAIMNEAFAGKFSSEKGRVEYAKLTTEGGHDILDARIALDATAMFGDAGGLGGMVGALLPKTIVLQISVDVTESIEDTARTATTLRYNSLSSDDTKTSLDTVSKLGLGDFSYDALSSDITTAMRDMISSLRTQLLVTFGAQA